MRTAPVKAIALSAVYRANREFQLASVPGLPREYLHYALIVRGSKTLKSRGRPGRKRHVR